MHDAHALLRGIRRLRPGDLRLVAVSRDPSGRRLRDQKLLRVTR